MRVDEKSQLQLFDGWLIDTHKMFDAFQMLSDKPRKPLPSLHLIEQHAMGALITFDQAVAWMVAIIKFFLYLRNNLFNEKGDFKLPITKWWSLAKAVAELVKEIIVARKNE